MCPEDIEVFNQFQVKSIELVRQHFHNISAMTKSDSSNNLLPKFGICIVVTGSSPHFSMVAVYCEYSTLRKCWTRKRPSDCVFCVSSWCWEQSKACIGYTVSESCTFTELRSPSFLVTGGYLRVKLTGFKRNRLSPVRKLRGIKQSNLQHTFHLRSWQICFVNSTL